MITTVFDEQGKVIHECRTDGCDVSWDGYALRDLEPADMHADEKTRPKDLQPVAKGQRVPNGADPDPARYDVRGQTARLKTDR